MSLDAIKAAFVGHEVDAEFMDTRSEVGENYTDNLSTTLAIGDRLARFYESPIDFFKSDLPLTDKIIFPLVAIPVSIARTLGLIAKIFLYIGITVKGVITGSIFSKIGRLNILISGSSMILDTIGRVVRNALRAVPVLGPLLSKLADVAVVAVQVGAGKVHSLILRKKHDAGIYREMDPNTQV